MTKPIPTPDREDIDFVPAEDHGDTDGVREFFRGFSFEETET